MTQILLLLLTASPTFAGKGESPAPWQQIDESLDSGAIKALEALEKAKESTEDATRQMKKSAGKASDQAAQGFRKLKKEATDESNWKKWRTEIHRGWYTALQTVSSLFQKIRLRESSSTPGWNAR